MKQRIQIQYKTEAGSVWTTEQQAMTADVLEKIPTLYLQKYDLTKIVEALSTSFLMIPAIDEEFYKEGKEKFDAISSEVDSYGASA